MNRRPSACIVTTSPISLDVLNRGILEALRNHGYRITGVSAAEPAIHVRQLEDRGFEVITVPFVRQPSALTDAKTLARLWWLLVRRRFDVVHCSTPKAMLLGSLAAWLSGSRGLILTIRGRAYESFTGPKRKFYVWLDKLTVRLARKVVVVSPSLRRALLADGIGPEEKLIVFGAGASKGVDAQWFSRAALSDAEVDRFRRDVGLPPNARALVFVGRVREDKGINELVSAFLECGDAYPDWHLLVVGPNEPVGHIDPQVQHALGNHPRIHLAGALADPRPAYAAADVCVLPSHREGFPNVPLEAASMTLPVVTTDAVGAVDSVRPGETGLIARAADAADLERAITKLMGDPQLRRQMGQAGRNWVRRVFAPERIQQANCRLFDVVAGIGAITPEARPPTTAASAPTESDRPRT